MWYRLASCSIARGAWPCSCISMEIKPNLQIYLRTTFPKDAHASTLFLHGIWPGNTEFSISALVSREPRNKKINKSKYTTFKFPKLHRFSLNFYKFFQIWKNAFSLKFCNKVQQKTTFKIEPNHPQSAKSKSKLPFEKA